MSSNILRPEFVLDESEYVAIDKFCFEHTGAAFLPDLADFLQKMFSLDFTIDKDIVTGYQTDSSNLKGDAAALCRPASERDCAAIFRACFKAGIPFTISAGRSNLTGSSTPNGGVIISTRNMLSPEVAVSEENLTVKSPVGIILEDMRNEVLRQTSGRLAFPVDPTSRADATVGGAIACNASGFVPGESGAIRQWVEAVEFLLPYGLKISARKGEYVSENARFVITSNGADTVFPVPAYERPTIKNAGGPYSRPDGKMDFVDMVIGSEGIFGLVTACTLKLAPRPSDYLDLFFSLPQEKDALAFGSYLKNKLNGDLSVLTALEYFGVNSRKFMVHQERLFRSNDQVAVYLQVPLHGQSIEEAAEEWLLVVMDSGCNIDENAVLLLDNDRDRKILLEARHSLPAKALEVVQHRGTYTIMTDTAVPPDRFSEFLDFTHAILAAEKLDYLAFGHFGDCHLHFTILPEKAQLERATEIYDEIVAKSASLGGVYSGEHGTGKRKRKDFLRCYGAVVVEELRRCKAAIDPHFLLNRNNVFEMTSAGPE